VAIANPLSEKFAVMRPSLLPGLVAALIYNRHREANDVRLFEVGSVFTPARELEKVGWVLTGARGGHWSGNGGAVDFFDAKGVAEMVARAFVFEITFTQADDLPWFVRGRAARLMKTGSLPLTEIGQIGEIRPDLLAARGLHAGAVFAGEINANPGDPFVPVAAEGARGPQVKPLPRYPSIVRDVSIVVPDRLPAAEVRGTIHAHAPATLVRVREFDRYQGKGVPAGQVSLSVRLTFQSADRTLTDAEVQQAVDVIVAALAREHGAVLRGATTT
jgi:phenylalanyl-tRNA synthetase beta chain